MTLGLAGGNLAYTVVIADRRLTTSGRVVDDEFPKVLVFESPSARLGVTFSGLTTAPRFQMFFVLPQCLTEAATKGPRPDDVVEAFAERLDEAFSSVPASVPEDARRTAILFAGYAYDDAGRPEMYLRSVSNYRLGETATHDFQVKEVGDSRRHNYMCAVGGWDALPEQGMTELRQLIDAGKPPEAVVGKAVAVIREAARSPGARQLIGGQLLSLVIPSDLSQAPSGAYHTETVSDTAYFPGAVRVDGTGHGMAVVGASVTSGALTPAQVRDAYRRGRSGMPRDTKQRFAPISIPKVGRNHPCPCGSGRKYKRCHGQ